MSGQTYGPYAGVVDRVVDGDTVDVALSLGFGLTYYAHVRIAGINAPEVRTLEGKIARDFAREILTPGDQVTVLSFGWEKYGRVLGSITMVDGTSFATKMLDAGQAVVYMGGHR